jgi:NitT/TauT family transport system substrate-binding protein
MKTRLYSSYLVILLMIFVAACGEDVEDAADEVVGEEAPDVESAADDEEADPEEATMPAELETVTVGTSSLHTWYWWATIARDEGLMEPYGIELDVVSLGGGDLIVAAVLSGDAQFGMVTPEGLASAQDHEPTLRMLGSAISVNPYTFVVTPDIESYEDLRGQTIGVLSVGNSADYFTGKLMMREHGLEEGDDYSMVNAGSPGERLAAMESGAVQAVLNFEPAAYQLIEEGMVALDASANYPNLAAVETAVVFGDEAWYSENRELAENFMRGFVDAIEWLYDPENRDRAVEILAAEMGVAADFADDTYERFVVELEAWDTSGQVSLERLQTSFENAREAGVEVAPADDDVEWRVDGSLLDAVLGDR